MKVINFFVIGDSGVGKSSLVDTYLWKLHFGYAYHDHLMDHRRYHIQLTEIGQIEELQNAVNQAAGDVCIYLVCFKVTDRKSLQAALLKWLVEIHRIEVKAKVFLLGLQSDLRGGRLFSKLRPDCVRQAEVLRLCRHHENLLYLECSSYKAQSVKAVFDNALNVVLYNEREAEVRIVQLYNLIRIKFKFDESDSSAMQQRNKNIVSGI